MDGSSRTTIPAYLLDTTEVIAQLGSSTDGLSEDEASARLEQYGRNELQRIDKVPAWLKFARQFKDLLIILLIVSTALSLYLQDYYTAVILAVIVILNANISFWQEYRAESIMASLEKLVVPTAKVLRSGKIQEVPTAELVPGDVIYIESGDSVPADSRIIQENELETNDFALTGESNPSRKFTHAIENTVELPLRHNLVFMGTTVAIGDAHCVIIGTGMHTELGRIANLSQETKEDPSPLQREIRYTAVLITKGTLGLASILTVITLQQDFGLKNAFMFAIGISSAMIPNGLPAAINIALTQAAAKLAKSKALVKRLSAVETLGATSIILTDKTGTLTQNQMTVEQLCIGTTSFWVGGGGYSPDGQILDANKSPLTKQELTKHELFFLTGVLGSNAHLHEPDDAHSRWFILGDPTEGALITLGRKAGLDEIALDKQYPELREHPFDSARKRMSSLRDYNGLKAFVKGAPESVLEKCTHIVVDGKRRPLTNADRALYKSRDAMLAESAMRNLAFAYRDLPDVDDPKATTLDEVEQKLTLLGMVSMIDPPREEVPSAIQAAQLANIPISIVTGDNAATAGAIALKAGLASSMAELRVISGSELRTMDDSQIIRLITSGKTIFSRVAPEDKLRIVELGKSAEHVVAVTGDGINDAPALKRADIGVAMGITGTDVSKQSSDIILLDDSFSSLISAIQQGRIIFQNIKKIILTVLTGNASELTVILISLTLFSIWGIPPAISVVLILAIDLVAELFPVAALAWDGPDNKIMEDKPRRLKDHILNRHSVIDITLSGILNGLLAYGAFIFYIFQNGATLATIRSLDADVYASAITLTYVTICLCMFGNILVRRSRSVTHAIFSSYLWANKELMVAFTLSLICIVLITYVPALNTFFGSGPLGAQEWLIAIMFALVQLAVRALVLFKKPITNPA